MWLIWDLGNHVLCMMNDDSGSVWLFLWSVSILIGCIVQSGEAVHGLGTSERMKLRLNQTVIIFFHIWNVVHQMITDKFYWFCLTFKTSISFIMVWYIIVVLKLGIYCYLWVFTILPALGHWKFVDSLNLNRKNGTSYSTFAAIWAWTLNN